MMSVSFVGVLLFTEAYNSTKSSAHPWAFFTIFKL